MDNYEHEIECPNHKGIINYLWYDHFHDSHIHQINFDHMKGLVILTLDCCLDQDKIWQKYNYNIEKSECYINRHIDEFTYILTFKGVCYFHEERIIIANDYIHGRFKETALLKKMQAEAKKALYHFRIQIDDGYIDIIFSDLKIRKKAGRVSYPLKEIPKSEIKFEKYKDMAFSDDDFKRLQAMTYLHSIHDQSLLEIARKNLRLEEDFEDSCFYSAYLLGKYGDLSDIQNLFELYLNTENFIVSKSVHRCGALLLKRNILDAIELIKERNEVKNI